MRRRRRNVFNNKMSRTLTVLYLGVLAVLFALCVIIAKINRDKGNDYTTTVLNQQNNTSRKIPYKRGDIIDRNGYTLANTVNTDAKGFNLSDKYNGFENLLEEIKRIFVRISSINNKNSNISSKKDEISDIHNLEKPSPDEIIKFIICNK